MMVDEQKKKIIMQYFSWLDSMVKVSNDFAFTDINISLESFILKLLNIVGVGKFENCNTKQINYPYIDLIDEENNIGIQITSETKSSKIKETLDKSSGLKISFFFLTMKYNPKKESYLSYPNFSVEDNVYTFEKIIKIIGNDDEMMDNVIEFLTSSIVLPVDINSYREKINGYSIYFREMILNNIEEVCKKFVPTSITMKCLKHLEEKNLLILIGNPGVGKSFNSKFLVAKYIEKGYKLLYSPNKNLRDILNDYNENDNFILFIDDIFGSNNIDFMNAISAEEITSILENKKDNLKIIINSRTGFFNEVNEKYDKIGRLQLKPFVIETSKFTNAEKARILIKHLKLSKIPSKYLYSLFEKGYTTYVNISNSINIYQIIFHQNYNPRLIDLMTRADFVNCSDNYFKTFIENLDNPYQIYDHAYDQNLTKLERDIIKVIYIKSDYRFNYFIPVEDIYKILSNFEVDDEDFKIAIRKLEQSFISTYIKNGIHYCKFYDPSIMDYCMNKFSQSHDMEKYIDYIECATELNNLILNKNISAEKRKKKIIELEYHNYELISKLESELVQDNMIKEYVKKSILFSERTRYIGDEYFFENKTISENEFLNSLENNFNYDLFISFSIFGYNNIQTSIIMKNFAASTNMVQDEILLCCKNEAEEVIEYEVKEYINSQEFIVACDEYFLESEYDSVKKILIENLKNEETDDRIIDYLQENIKPFFMSDYNSYIEDVFENIEDINDNLDRDTIETINIVEDYYKTII